MWWVFQLTTWVSLDALATASPLSSKYLNQITTCRLQLSIWQFLVTPRHLLVEVRLKAFYFGFDRSDSLQDFLLQANKMRTLACGDVLTSRDVTVCNTAQIWKAHRLKRTWMATPKSLPSSILGMRCWIQLVTCKYTDGSRTEACGEHSPSGRVASHLTVMMVSRRPTISGFNLPTSTKMISWDLMKPHVGSVGASRGLKLHDITTKSRHHRKHQQYLTFFLLLLFVLIRLHVLSQSHMSN